MFRPETGRSPLTTQVLVGRGILDFHVINSEIVFSDHIATFGEEYHLNGGGSMVFQKDGERIKLTCNLGITTFDVWLESHTQYRIHCDENSLSSECRGACPGVLEEMLRLLNIPTNVLKSVGRVKTLLSTLNTVVHNDSGEPIGQIVTVKRGQKIHIQEIEISLETTPRQLAISLTRALFELDKTIALGLDYFAALESVEFARQWIIENLDIFIGRGHFSLCVKRKGAPESELTHFGLMDRWSQRGLAQALHYLLDRHKDSARTLLEGQIVNPRVADSITTESESFLGVFEAWQNPIQALELIKRRYDFELLRSRTAARNSVSTIIYFGEKGSEPGNRHRVLLHDLIETQIFPGRLIKDLLVRHGEPLAELLIADTPRANVFESEPKWPTFLDLGIRNGFMFGEMCLSEPSPLCRDNSLVKIPVAKILEKGICLGWAGDKDPSDKDPIFHYALQNGGRLFLVKKAELAYAPLENGQKCTYFCVISTQSKNSENWEVFALWAFTVTNKDGQAVFTEPRVDEKFTIRIFEDRASQVLVARL